LSRKYLKVENTLDDGWVGGWVDGWMKGKASLRIAYSNQQNKNGLIFKNQVSNFIKIKF
jgi:hypothetical protein